MAFQFPLNPVAGQLFNPIAGVTYKWDGFGWVPVASGVLTVGDGDLRYVQLTGGTMTGRLVVDVNGQASFITAGLESRSSTGNAGIGLHCGPVSAAYIEHVRGIEGIRVHSSTGVLAPVLASKIGIAGIHRIRDSGSGVMELMNAAESDYTNLRLHSRLYMSAGGVAVRGNAFSPGWVDFTNAVESGPVNLAAGTIRSQAGSSAASSGFQINSGADLGSLYVHTLSSATLAGAISSGTLTVNMPTLHGGTSTFPVSTLTIDGQGRITAWT